MYKNLLPIIIIKYAIASPSEYQRICFNHKLEKSLGSNFLVEYIEITLIIKNNIIGIRIDFSILNLDMFFMLSPHFY